MKRNIGNIWVSSSSFDAINEIYYKSKAKNFSHVVDNLIAHYLTLTAKHEQLIAEIGKLKQEINQLQKVVNDYRTQIVKEVK